MRALLDTHVLLWMSADSDRLSPLAKTTLLDDRNTLFVSVASWWEIGIKIGLGKLELLPTWAVTLKREMRHNGIEWLPVRPEHCEKIPCMPFHHRDPFDRMLIAQAQTESLAMVTADPQFGGYGIEVVW